MTDHGFGDKIAVNHAALLTASAISPDVARARGYFTATTKTQVKALGFTEGQALVPSLVLPVLGVDGDVVSYQIRPDQPRIVKGKALKYETPKGSTMRLDVPPSSQPLLRDPQRDLFITEGARKADAAVSRGLCCIGLLGVWNWRGTNDAGGKTALSDWERIALNGRRVYIVFDSDVMEKAAVHASLQRLKDFLESRGALVRVIYLPAGAGGSKVGLDDYLAANHSVDELLGLATEELRQPEADRVNLDDMPPVDWLVHLGRQAELFSTPDHVAYAYFNVDGCYETARIRQQGNGAFRRWLTQCYLRCFERAPSGHALDSALETLEALAFQGPKTEVHTRVAECDGRLYLDLGDERRRVVEIGPDEWRVIENAPVRFVRRRNMAALPVPERGGSIRELRRFLNVTSERDFTLLVAWLVGALRAKGNHPISIINGEQGSAKTTTVKMLRNLIDPVAQAPTRGLPNDERDLFVAANQAHIQCYSNLSHLSGSMSDAFCRLATGEGYATRQLYTDDEEVVFGGSKPISLNGITDFADRADLLDRAIVIALPPIPDEMRRDESDLMADFEAARPHILGALLDAASTALRRVHGVQIDRPPRMADFAYWVVAAEPSLPWSAGEFLTAYEANRALGVEVSVEASPVATVIREWVHGDLAKSPDLLGAPEWAGTATELFEELERRCPQEECKSKTWPKNHRALSQALRRLAPGLRRLGIEIVFGERKGNSRTKLIRIRSADAGRTQVLQDGGKADANFIGEPVARSVLVPKGLPDGGRKNVENAKSPPPSVAQTVKRNGSEASGPTRGGTPDENRNFAFLRPPHPVEPPGPAVRSRRDAWEVIDL